MCVCVCVCVCVLCVCERGEREEKKNYTGNIMTIGHLVITIFKVLMSAFVVGLVKRGVFILCR